MPCEIHSRQCEAEQNGLLFRSAIQGLIRCGDREQPPRCERIFLRIELRHQYLQANPLFKNDRCSRSIADVPGQLSQETPSRSLPGDVLSTTQFKPSYPNNDC